MKTYKIFWQKQNKVVEVAEGTSILDAALDHNIPLEHACGGFCACTTCHLHIVEGFENLSGIEEEEQDRLDEKENRVPNSRLACQSKVFGDITVEIP